MLKGSELIESMKPGDSFQFVECHRWAGKSISTLTVERFTPTTVVCRVGRSELRFRRATGSLIGDRFVSFPTPATDVEIEAVTADNERRNLAYSMRKVKWEALSLEDLKTVHSILEKQP